MRKLITTVIIIVAFATASLAQEYNYKLIDINPPRFYSDSCECFIKTPLSSDTLVLKKQIEFAKFAVLDAQRIAAKEPTQENTARLIFWGIRLKDLVTQYNEVK